MFLSARETVPPSTQQYREAPLKDDNFMYYVPSPNREQDPPSPPTHPPIAGECDTHILFPFDRSFGFSLVFINSDANDETSSISIS